MPIKFRCPHCRQFLGISRAKAGEIADCPMCGKSLRVPNLDGTVQPLPQPKLDLQDSSLVSALGELAGIGTETPSRRAERKASKEQATVAIPPAPQPVVLEPLQAAEPVVISAAPHVRPRSASRGPVGSVPAVADQEATRNDPPVSSADDDRPHSRTAWRQSRFSRSRIWLPVVVGLGLLLMGGAGLLMMARTAPDPAVTTGLADDIPTAESPPPQETTAVPPAMTGRITYVSESGDTRPDDGAKVIALPSQRGGTVKLDVAGFMVGSSEVDEQVASAALEALGGDVVTANERGEYSISLPRAGNYSLLVISRHQSRAWQVGVESAAQDLLDRFFIRPSTLLGQLAYEVHPFQYRGRGTEPRDFAFEHN